MPAVKSRGRRSRDRRRDRPGARPPERRARADRLGELRQPGRARGRGQRPDQQVRRGLPRPALLRRLRVRRPRSSAWPSSAPKELFGAEHANVQPHSGTSANMAVYFALLQPGRHAPGHGPLATAATSPTATGSPSPGATSRSSPTASTARASGSTTTRCARLAREHRPKMIVCGATAYPRTIDFARFRDDRRRGRRAADGRHRPHRRAGRRRAPPLAGAALPTSSPRPRTRPCAARAAA